MHSKVWTDMFVLALPVAEKILRPMAVYFFLVIGLRMAGKRELAQLNPFDLVVLLTLSNTVQNAIIGDDNSVTGGIIGASVGLNFVLIYILARTLLPKNSSWWGPAVAFVCGAVGFSDPLATS